MNNSNEVANASDMSVSVVTQYVKDVSFENPGAPDTFIGQPIEPEIEVGCDINVKPRDGNTYEIDLQLTGTAKQKDMPLFVVEVTYGGLFKLGGVPPEQVELVCLVECPRLLFPFARQILADMTRSGGFPPLLIDPIDFASLYRKHQESKDQN